MQQTLAELTNKIALINRLLNNQIRGWSLKEMSETIGISESTLYREIKKGKLKTYKIGGSSRISHAELIRYNHGNDPVKEAFTHLQLLIRVREQLNDPEPADKESEYRSPVPYPQKNQPLLTHC